SGGSGRKNAACCVVPTTAALSEPFYGPNRRFPPTAGAPVAKRRRGSGGHPARIAERRAREQGARSPMALDDVALSLDALVKLGLVRLDGEGIEFLDPDTGLSASEGGSPRQLSRPELMERLARSQSEGRL